MKVKKARNYHLEYLRRKSRGYHPQEVIKKGRVYPKRVGKGAISKPKIKKTFWYLYSYIDTILEIYTSLNTRDITKSKYYRDSKKLFEMHEWFRDWFEDYFAGKVEIEPCSIDEINVSSNFDRDGGTYRYFEFLYIDAEDDETIFHLKYAKGNILDFKMPKPFSMSDFLNKIRSLKVWG